MIILKCSSKNLEIFDQDVPLFMRSFLSEKTHTTQDLHYKFHQSWLILIGFPVSASTGRQELTTTTTIVKNGGGTENRA